MFKMFQALQYYSKTLNKPWDETANYIELMNRLFKTLNCNSQFAHERRRDESRRAIFFDDRRQSKFLREFRDWAIEWTAMQTKKSLTAETFFCLLQTVQALADLADYLLDTGRLQYVLLGKINSDDIESRFGNYRQLSGGNFYVSVHQVLENEKKIRIRALVRFDKLSISEIRNITSCDQSTESVENNAIRLCSLINNPDNNEEDFNFKEYNTLKGIVTYVGGGIVRSLLRNKAHKGCESCKDLLVKKESIPPI